MIRKSGSRFFEKIMLQEYVTSDNRFNLKRLRSDLHVVRVRPPLT